MSLKENFTKALVDSVTDSFKTMLSIDLAANELSSGGALDADTICTIGIAGAVEGSISVSFSEFYAAFIVSKMLGMDVPPGSPDINDGMREVANVIAGGIKMRSALFNTCFDISIPTVIQGELMHINVPDDLERIGRRFSADKVQFDVEFVFKVKKEEGVVEAKSSAQSSKLSAFEKLKALTAKAK